MIDGVWCLLLIAGFCRLMTVFRCLRVFAWLRCGNEFRAIASGYRCPSLEFVAVCGLIPNDKQIAAASRSLNDCQFQHLFILCLGVYRIAANDDLSYCKRIFWDAVANM